LRVTRRSFLAAAAGTAAVGAAGCSGGGRTRPGPTTTSSTTIVPGTLQPSGDLAVAGRAAALETAFAAAYGAVLGLDRVGSVPVGLKGMWQTFQSHHRDHATAWNAIVTAAGQTAVTSGDAAFTQAVVTPGLAAVKDVDGAISFLAGIERAAAATYLTAVEDVLTTPGALQTAAAIQPVELQHAAMLELLHGNDPVPASFATRDGALALS